jgi:hypothetical protein
MKTDGCPSQEQQHQWHLSIMDASTLRLVIVFDVERRCSTDEVCRIGLGCLAVVAGGCCELPLLKTGTHTICELSSSGSSATENNNKDASNNLCGCAAPAGMLLDVYRDAEGGQPLYWGATDEGQLLLGSHLNDLEGCEPTATMFPPGTKHTDAVW